MKAKLVCTKHNIHLDGFPLWDLVTVDPDVYTISFKSMHCPESQDSDLATCSPSDWDIITELDIAS